MPSQREIRRRIGSVKNIKQITRAMQFVAASKLKRAQDATLQARPYREKLDEVIADVAAVLSHEDHPLLARREGRRPAEAEPRREGVRLGVAVGLVDVGGAVGRTERTTAPRRTGAGHPEDEDPVHGAGTSSSGKRSSTERMRPT